jgi:hypothetical protein
MAPIDTRGDGPVGRPVLDREGRNLGKLERVYGEGDAPRWGAVKPGRFGRSHLVPLGDARSEGEEIRLAATEPQVKNAPRPQRGAALSPELEDRLRHHYHEPPAAPRRKQAVPARRRRIMAVPRSRGAASAALLLLLGLWGGFSPLVGPYFGYAFGQDDAWNATTDMLWLSFLPAAVVVVGALVLMASANRAGGAIGAWLALAGGGWFVIGPAFSVFWDAGGPGAPIGRPLGGEGLRVTELLWSFYALGALIIAVAAFALGRLATVSVRDVEVARRRERG